MSQIFLSIEANSHSYLLVFAPAPTVGALGETHKVFLYINEMDRKIWPKWRFRSRFILGPTGS